MTNPGHKQTSNQEIVRAPKSAVRRLEKALTHSLTETSRLKANLHTAQTISGERLRVAKMMKRHADHYYRAARRYKAEIVRLMTNGPDTRTETDRAESYAELAEADRKMGLWPTYFD